MFKALFNRKARSRDLRFLDSEHCTKAHLSSQSFENEYIQVNKTKSAYSLSRRTHPKNSFLECIKQATSEEIFVEENGIVQGEGVFDEKKIWNSVGVFSDSKIYSALIYSVLSDYN